MKKIILSSGVVFIAAALLLSIVIIKGEAADERADDSAITAQVIKIIRSDESAQSLKIEVTTVQGDVVLKGFVNDRETEERLVVKIKQIKGVKSVNSLLKLEENK